MLLMQVFLYLYFLQILDFLITDIFLEQGIIYFSSGNVSTGTDIAINFDLGKRVKNKYI